jgi:hypothetical protein
MRGVRLALLDATAAGEEGLTPLHQAAKSNSNESREVLRAMLQYAKDNGIRLDINARDDWRQTPLHFACLRHDNISSIRILLEFNADPNAKDSQDITPLHKACSSGNTKVPPCLHRMFNRRSFMRAVNRRPSPLSSIAKPTFGCAITIKTHRTPPPAYCYQFEVAALPHPPFLLLLTWLTAVAVWRYGRIEERWTAPGSSAG